MGGKTRSGLAVARSGPPAPLFGGGGARGRGKGGKASPLGGSLTPQLKRQVSARPLEGPPAGLGGPGVAGRAGRPRLLQRAHRRCWARSGRGPEEPGAHACAGSALPAPPLPPRSPAAPSEPPPQPARSPRGRRPLRPVRGLTPSPQCRPAPAELRSELRRPPRARLAHARLRPRSPSPPRKHFLRTAGPRGGFSVAGAAPPCAPAPSA